ncbi:23923_t:CDS:1, partial [Racocetra persica]
LHHQVDNSNDKDPNTKDDDFNDEDSDITDDDSNNEAPKRQLHQSSRIDSMFN